MHRRHPWKRHEWGIGHVRDVQNGELLGVRGKKDGTVFGSLMHL
jgi:hypothetical protein